MLVHDHAPSTTDVTRRSLLVGSGAVALSMTSPGRAVASAEPRLVGAQRAEALANAWGINVHYDFQTTVYGDEKRVTDILLDLGVRHIRNRYKPGHPAIQYGFRRLANNGCRVNAICGVFDDRNQPTMAELMDAVVSEFGRSAARVFSAFEGINEPNNNGIPWVEETRRMQSQLWWARSARTQTASIPVVGPALARRIDGSKFGMTNDERTKLDYQRLGDLSSKCTRGNIHVYTGDDSPRDEIRKFMNWASKPFGNRRITCTEGGFWNHLGPDGKNVIPKYSGGSQAIPEDVAAMYIPRQICEHFLHGNRFFTYELLDRVRNADSDRGAHFGLVRNDYTRKPAFHAMRRFLNLVGDRNPRTFTPSSVNLKGLRYRVHGEGADFRSILVQRSTGEHLLLMWRNVQLYEYDASAHVGKYLKVNGYSVRVTLGRSAPVKLYRPSTRSRPIERWKSRTSFDVPLAGELVIAEIG